jgi:CubicO group peptidase (beta-lactamase class C family)
MWIPLSITTRPRAAVALLLLLPLVGCSPAHATQDTRAARVDALFERFNRTPSPGLAIAVVDDGRVILRKGYGMANLEDQIPITPSTVFDIASVSKQFAGLAIAMLIEQGKVRLTDDIRKHIPELPDIGHTITVDHLLHHTSGLRDWPGTLAVAGWRMDDVISFDQILSMAYHQKTLNFTPGAEYTYSNTGYNLLAELVERVTGQSFRAWTDQHLFKPLGMTSSFFRDDHTALVRHRALGYAREPDNTFRSIPNNLTALGSSSLFSTVDDLAKWVLNFDNPVVGGQAAMAMTRTRGKLNSDSTISYAFGVSHGEYRGQPTVAHSGGWASFGTYLVHFPNQKFGVIVLGNSPIANPSRAAFEIADIYLEKELAPRAASPTPETGRTVEVSTDVLRNYVGVYKLGPGWYVRIRQDGRTLRAQASGENEFPMSARSDSVFWVDAYGATISFRRDDTGRVTHFVYRDRRAPRMDETRATRPAGTVDFVGSYVSDELQTTYEVVQRNDSLVLRHRRHGTIPLTPGWEGDFTTPLWFLRSVEFQRDDRGMVTGFVVNVDERSRNIRFVKR